MIDTDKFSIQLRDKMVDTTGRRIRITRLQGSEQEADLSVPVNCEGFGRIHHFRRTTSEGWPENPLPIDPAANRLGLGRLDMIRAQVFQNAGCNWRCWYCFVPFSLLNANPALSDWLTAEQLVQLYCEEKDAPLVIDLSGGQPDLTPEWVPWMMNELRREGRSDNTYLWSDDNLSNDYFWRYLSEEDIDTIQSYKNYGKVCCFKGFNADSFAFNTKASPAHFDYQFTLFEKYLTLNIDLYAYATFTASTCRDIKGEMNKFVDRLQKIHPNLPLRVVPLEIRSFSPLEKRMNADHLNSISIQNGAITCWNEELKVRFSEEKRGLAIYEIPLD